jgi:DNA-binding NarL/FixJ family response regulator
MLADDAVLFREGMARILTEAGFDVAGQARDAAALLDLVRHDPPDAAIIDIRMPPGHSAEGIEAAVAIRQMCPGVGLLLLSQHVDTHHALRLMTEFRGAWATSSRSGSPT